MQTLLERIRRERAALTEQVEMEEQSQYGEERYGGRKIGTYGAKKNWLSKKKKKRRDKALCHQGGRRQRS